MTAALQTAALSYPRVLMSELDFKDNRYPTVSSSQARNTQRSSGMLLNSSDRVLRDTYYPNSSDGKLPQLNFEPTDKTIAATPLGAENPTSSQNLSQSQYFPNTNGTNPKQSDVQSIKSQSQQFQDPPRSSLSYALPPGAARRVVERYSLDEDQQGQGQNQQRAPSRLSSETRQTPIDSALSSGRIQQQQQQQELSMPLLPSTPRHPAVPTSSTGAGLGVLNNSQYPPIMPLSASPTYNPPVASKHRAYPQQPTYVTPISTSKPVNVISTSIPQPKEEVCVECAMRDQDMADVDVTSPGVWERASDAEFEELKQRELDDELNGRLSGDPSKPRVKGGRLSEQNLKMWLSINPKEPMARHQTLTAYIKSQRALLDAEAQARDRATKEARQLDNKMRDTFSQLRRSAYDTGSNVAPMDDTGGVRIKSPLSPISHSTTHGRSQSRDVTLLENGMIVEHVDIRREEKEAKERKKKEGRRARKSSKSSVMDASIISAQSFGQQTEPGLKPYSRYSQSSSARPISVLTAPLERPDLPRANSQASFSDVHSLGSSARRTRFFGMRNLAAGWMSQDSLAPSGMSGSMVDMHVALQRETNQPYLTGTPIDLSTPRLSQIWPSKELNGTGNSITEDKMKKKKNGLAKIWRIVTGGKSREINDISPSDDKNDDDLPLAPPPPLSYLVSRGPLDMSAGNRHASTPSLPSTTSPKFLASPGMSTSTVSSSILPSPTSYRPSGLDVDTVEIRQPGDDSEIRQKYDELVNKQQSPTKIPNLSPTSEFNVQQTATTPKTTGTQSPSHIRTQVPIVWDKSLPPLPPGIPPIRAPENRPRTVYTYPTLPAGSAPAHDFLPPQAPFRDTDTRRQSFGGLSARPNLAMQTLPAGAKPAGLDTARTLSTRYDEFGLSRQSLGRLDSMPFEASSPVPSTKRKSKFGFASFLGKKHHPREQELTLEPDNTMHPFPSIRRSGSDGQDDIAMNGYATSTSRHSALSIGGINPNMRTSITSRKALEDVVPLDDEFVAYRYPSTDQRLDLLR